jgi:hypothetical protein
VELMSIVYTERSARWKENKIIPGNFHEKERTRKKGQIGKSREENLIPLNDEDTKKSNQNILSDIKIEEVKGFRKRNERNHQSTM